MPRGVRPKLREDKESRGTLRAGREPKHPAPRVAGTPMPPPWMDPIGKEYWHRVAHILVQRYQLTQDDVFALEGLCRTYVEWRAAADEMEDGGRYQEVKTVGGDVMERARPCVAAFSDADRRLRAYLIEFGLTPASRGRINVPDQPPEKPDQPGATPSKSDDPLREYGLN